MKGHNVPKSRQDARANANAAEADIVAALKRWTVDTALPLWATIGVCDTIGGFHERLHLDGTPDRQAIRRTRVQARQIYVYAHAFALGWYPQGLQVALRGLEFLLERCRSPDGAPGFVHAVLPDGGVGDPLRDLYDHAFILLALAWLARASGDAQVSALVDQTLAFVDERLSAGDGTFLEGIPPSEPRRQNPHMHLFEAMLSLHAAIGHPQALDRAAVLRGLLATRFADPETGALREFFRNDWQPWPAPQGNILEPGHHAEWAWLLRTHERLTGLAPDPRASALLDRAMATAQPETGFLPDEVDVDGAILRASRRCWPQTEAAKAWCAEHEAGRTGAAQAAERVLQGISRHYLAGPVAGGWIDRFDGAGQPAVNDIPASTLYHLFVAIAEADRVLGTRFGST